MPTPLTLHFSGPLRIDGSDEPLTTLSRRGQALLAFLAFQPGMRAERLGLAELLWSNRGEEQARASLRQELSMLRRELPEGVMEADRQAVWLNPSRIRLAEGSGEFLQGFDLASEGFEEWLREERARHADRQTPAVPGSMSRPALAVLAFQDLNGVTDMFADGVVEEITGVLSRVGEFDVIARQSAFALQNEQLDVPAAAERLGADYVVEGSVRRVGDRVRIGVQLVRGSDGHTLWADRFDDRLDDLFDLHDRIAAQVTGQLSPSLRSAEIARARSIPPADRSAYDLTLAALPQFWSHRKEGNARAIARLDAAIERDPHFGPALAYRAWALAQQPVYMWSEDPASDHRSAEQAARAAIEWVGDHPPSLVAVGAALSISSTDTAGALALIDRALLLDPNNAWGWMRRGWAKIYSGQPDPAREAFKKAETLSPLDPFRFNMLFGRALSHRLDNRSDIAVEIVREGIAANPGLTWAYRLLVGDLVLAGLFDEAKEAAERLKRHYPHVTMRYLHACLPLVENEVHPNYLLAMRQAGIPEG